MEIAGLGLISFCKIIVCVMKPRTDSHRTWLNGGQNDFVSIINFAGQWPRAGRAVSILTRDRREGKNSRVFIYFRENRLIYFNVAYFIAFAQAKRFLHDIPAYCAFQPFKLKSHNVSAELHSVLGDNEIVKPIKFLKLFASFCRPFFGMLMRCRF